MNKEKIFWGVALILGAIVLIVNQLGYFPPINIFSLIFSLFLISIMIKSLFKLNFWGVLFPLAFICIIYDEQLGLTELSSWTVLCAALLGSIGLSMLIPKRRKNNIDVKWSYTDSNPKDYETIDILDENHIFLETSFAGSIKYINTDKFESAKLKCNFGGMKVYFDNATLHNGKGVIQIDASFSGVELYIPKTWFVEDKMNVSFGSVHDKNRNSSNLENSLTLVGTASFSDISIIYI